MNFIKLLINSCRSLLAWPDKLQGSRGHAGAINKPKAYFLRESDVKSKKFILSYISNNIRGFFKHVIVPTLSSKKVYPSLSEASRCHGEDGFDK